MSILQLSIQAQLARASYSTLLGGMATNALEDALQPNGGDFTATQAQQFAAKYGVILQYNDDASSLVGNDTGLSVSLMLGLPLRLRGTHDAEKGAPRSGDPYMVSANAPASSMDRRGRASHTVDVHKVRRSFARAAR